MIATTLLWIAWISATLPPEDRSEHLRFDPQSEQWVEVAPPQAGTPEGDLELAIRTLKQQKPKKARRALKKWLENHGASHALAREAKLRMGETLIAMREFYKAHRIFQELILELGSDEVTLNAAQHEFIIAEKFLSGTKRKWLGMRIAPAQDLGIEILDGLCFNFPDTSLGELAHKTKADHYFDRGDFDLAEDEYLLMLRSYPKSRYVRWCELRRGQAALAQFAGTRFDDAPLIEAEERLLRFRERFPQAATHHQVDLILEDIRSRRAHKELEIGQYYLKVGKLRSAAFYFESVERNWPDTLAAIEAENTLERITDVNSN